MVSLWPDSRNCWVNIIIQRTVSPVLQQRHMQSCCFVLCWDGVGNDVLYFISFLYKKKLKKIINNVVGCYFEPGLHQMPLFSRRGRQWLQ